MSGSPPSKEGFRTVVFDEGDVFEPDALLFASGVEQVGRDDHPRFQCPIPCGSAVHVQFLQVHVAEAESVKEDQHRFRAWMRLFGRL